MSYSGQPLKRFEDPKLVAGEGTFVGDIKRPGMLHACVLRSLHAHALIRSIDASSARRMPGVIAVMTGDDIGDTLKEIPVGTQRADVMKAPRHPVLPRGKVCYVGQPVAIAVAEDRYLARDAIDHIEIDYEPLSPLLDPFEAMKEDSIPIHQELGTNLALRLRQQGGDLEKAFTQAEHLVHQTYQVQRLAPVPLETRGMMAWFQPEEDLLTIWNSTQAPHRLRTYLSQLFNRPEECLRVIAPDVGGSFGVKDCIFPEDILVPYLSLTLKRPIKWVEERQENMLAYHGRDQTLDVEAAVRKDGLILGMRVRIVADLGAFFLFTTSAPPTNAGRRFLGPYKIPAIDVEVVGLVTNKTPTGAYRGTGSPEAAYSMEGTIDLIAKDLNLDPAEVRRKNLISPDAFPYTTPTGVTYDSGNYQQVLNRALELSDYHSFREKASQRRTDEPFIGIGLATVLKSSGSSGYHRVESAGVKIEPSGQIVVFTGISPHGQGSETAFAQIVADELGVSPGQVQVLHGDTAIFPSGEGTSASRGLVVGGAALYIVLREACQKLSLIASRLLGCSPEEVSFQDGSVFNARRPSDSVPFPQLAAAAYNAEMVPPGVAVGLDFSDTYTLPDNPYSFGAHVAVVEVERSTGEAKILRYVAVHDCGRIINPKLVEGQMHGGIAQGIGQALVETIMHNEDGQPLTGSLMDYAMPTAEDMPDLVLDAIETPSPTNPLGAKGVGSFATVAPPAAVANAVLNALSGLGIRHIDTPLTSEKIWRAIQSVAGASIVGSQSSR